MSNWAGRYDGGAGLECIYYGTGETQLLPVVNDPGSEWEVDGPITVDNSGPMRHCIQVDWPAQGAWLNLHEKPDDFHPRKSWMGSLIQHGRDASGQYYRRNRYYDASTGRFTQEDPIGLAGGINLYGFANGDPVSYSDPYGLCPPEDDNDGRWCTSPMYPTLRFFGVSDKWASLVAQIGYGAAGDAGAPGMGAGVRGIAGGAAAGARASAAGGRAGLRAFELDAQSTFTRSFETRAGTIDVAVEASTQGRTLVVREVAVYPQGPDAPNSVGPAAMLRGLRMVEDEARQRGYERIILQAHRTKNGRVIDRVIDLNK